MAAGVVNKKTLSEQLESKSCLEEDTGDNSTIFTIQGFGCKLDNPQDVAPALAKLEPFKTSSKPAKPVTSVRLSGNTFASEAVRAVAESLGFIETLKFVNASDIFTSRVQTEVPPSITALGEALKDKADLTEVDLSDNALGPSGAKALGTLIRSNHNIKTLRVHNDGLGQEGGKYIAAALVGRTEIAEAIAEDLDPSKFAKLETIVCGRNRLENPGAEAFAFSFKHVQTLTAIRLPQNGIRPEGIVLLAEGLKSNKKLRILDLNDNTIKEQGALALSKAFSVLEELQNINLGDCLIGSKGVAAIASSLTTQSKLEELDLSYDEIGNAGALALAASLKNKKSLKKLELNGNKIRSEGLEAIKEVLEENRLSDVLGEMDENDEEEEDEEDGGESEEDEKSD